RVGKHQHVNGVRLDFARAGHAARGRGVELPVEVFGDYQDFAHYTNPFCFSAATSSTTSFTITPRERLAGAEKCIDLISPACSMPRDASSIVSIGLDLAFMMSGSLMKRGSLRRRSVVTTAGRSTSMVSRPASTSRVTVALPSAISTLDANVACGRSHNAASIWPVWLQSSSIA